MKLDKVREEAGDLFVSFEKVGKKALHSLEKQFPGLPDDYLEFLGEIGFGSAKNVLMIYEGPTPPRDIFGDDDPELRDILLFGDDFSGTCFGFDIKSGWEVVAVNADRSVDPIAKSFGKFIKKKAKRISKY